MKRYIIRAEGYPPWDLRNDAIFKLEILGDTRKIAFSEWRIHIYDFVEIMLIIIIRYIGTWSNITIIAIKIFSRTLSIIFWFC